MQHGNRRTRNRLLVIYSRNIDARKLSKRALVALGDDVKYGDVTSRAIGLKRTVARVVITAREKCILAGVAQAHSVLASRGVEVIWNRKRGETVRAGEVVLEAVGDVRALLETSRTVLNYLSVMSGIATATNRLSKRFGLKVSGLRKSHPQLLYDEKDAISAGGGLTHRLNLGDAVLIKKEYVAAYGLSKQKRGVGRSVLLVECTKNAVLFARKRGLIAIVEVNSLYEALAVAKEGPDVIMLDNFSVGAVRKAVGTIRKFSKSIIVEASGGITSRNAGAYLGAGADVVSMSALSFSKPIDFRLELLDGGIRRK